MIVRPALQPDTAQDGADAGDQFAGAEWLGQIIVRAQFQPDDTIGLAALGADEDDGNIALAPDLAAQVYAVGARQHDVQHDQIDRPGVERHPHFRSRRGRTDLIAMFLQRPCGQRTQWRVVLDQDDGGGGHDGNDRTLVMSAGIRSPLNRVNHVKLAKRTASATATICHARDIGGWTRQDRLRRACVTGPAHLDQKAAVSEKTTWLRAIDLPTSLLSPDTMKLGRR
jgi:hypothetical protein